MLLHAAERRGSSRRKRHAGMAAPRVDSRTSGCSNPRRTMSRGGEFAAAAMANSLAELTLIAASSPMTLSRDSSVHALGETTVRSSSDVRCADWSVAVGVSVRSAAWARRPRAPLFLRHHVRLRWLSRITRVDARNAASVSHRTVAHRTRRATSAAPLPFQLDRRACCYLKRSRGRRPSCSASLLRPYATAAASRLAASSMPVFSQGYESECSVP